MIPLTQEFRAKYPSMPLYLKGNSGFASPDLYEVCEENDCKYAIRMKQNPPPDPVCTGCGESPLPGNQREPDRLCRRIRGIRLSGWQLAPPGKSGLQCGETLWPDGAHVYFRCHYKGIPGAGSGGSVLDQVVQYYCGQGKMENFIKEGKNRFDFSSVSSHLMTVNTNRL